MADKGKLKDASEAVKEVTPILVKYKSDFKPAEINKHLKNPPIDFFFEITDVVASNKEQFEEAEKANKLFEKISETYIQNRKDVRTLISSMSETYEAGGQLDAVMDMLPTPEPMSIIDPVFKLGGDVYISPHVHEYHTYILNSYRHLIPKYRDSHDSEFTYSEFAEALKKTYDISNPRNSLAYEFLTFLGELRPYNSDDMDKVAEKLSKFEHPDLFAKGGVTEHGLKKGDTITDDLFWENTAVVKTADNNRAKVDLETGNRNEIKEQGGEATDDASNDRTESNADRGESSVDIKTTDYDYILIKHTDEYAQKVYDEGIDEETFMIHANVVNGSQYAKNIGANTLSGKPFIISIKELYEVSNSSNLRWFSQGGDTSNKFILWADTEDGYYVKLGEYDSYVEAKTEQASIWNENGYKRVEVVTKEDWDTYYKQLSIHEDGRVKISEDEFFNLMHEGKKLKDLAKSKGLRPSEAKRHWNAMKSLIFTSKDLSYKMRVNSVIDNMVALNGDDKLKYSEFEIEDLKAYSFDYKIPFNLGNTIWGLVDKYADADNGHKIGKTLIFNSGIGELLTFVSDESTNKTCCYESDAVKRIITKLNYNHLNMELYADLAQIKNGYDLLVFNALKNDVEDLQNIKLAVNKLNSSKLAIFVVAHDFTTQNKQTVDFLNEHFDMLDGYKIPSDIKSCELLVLRKK